MTSSLLLAVIASGFIYAITPGPGVLAVFGIGAARGRQAGAGFLCGHMLGDVVWCSTALIAIVGAREIGSDACLLYTSPSPRDQRGSRMPSSA